MKTNLEVGPAKHTQGGYISIGFYGEGAVALMVESARGREAVATVNLPEVNLPPRQIILKGWSENEGIPEALEKAGLVKLTGETIPTGFCFAEIAEMEELLLIEVELIKQNGEA